MYSLLALSSNLFSECFVQLLVVVVIGVGMVKCEWALPGHEGSQVSLRIWHGGEPAAFDGHLDVSGVSARHTDRPPSTRKRRWTENYGGSQGRKKKE